MSRAVVRIPTPLRDFTNGLDEVTIDATSVADLFADLGRRHPGITARLLDDQGELRPFINVFVGGKNIRNLGGLGAAVAEGDVVAILPAVAGGCPEAGSPMRPADASSRSWGRF
jgi:molybdopterin converting factor small subunit